MKSLVITAFMLLALTVGANAQERQRVFTAEEQAIVDLSNNKWDWMSEKNVDKLAELYHIDRSGYYADLVLVDPDRTWTVAKENDSVRGMEVRYLA